MPHVECRRNQPLPRAGPGRIVIGVVAAALVAVAVNAVIALLARQPARPRTSNR
jgi:hypothetical protein